MGLETGTGIGDLVPTNPLSTDAVSAGDDHIRLIKTVMQSITFLKSIQTFTTVGVNTWTRPANVRKILVYCLGGGGGGGGGTVNSYSGGGGSGGATALKWLDVTAITSATVTIGTGGAAGAIGAAGGAGSLTDFVSAGPVTHCQAREGTSGGSAAAAGISIPRSSSTGDIIIAGGCGQYGNIAVGATVFAFGAAGGGAGGTNSTAAEPNSGGGGGGGPATAAAAFPGAAGGSGYCIVFEFGW